VLKEAIKRRKPDFSETRYGFRAFGNLLEEAQSRGLLEFGRDEKSGTYVYRSGGAVVRAEQPATEPAVIAEGQAEMLWPSRRNLVVRPAVVDGAATSPGSMT
jgi:hypothetical protein